MTISLATLAKYNGGRVSSLISEIARLLLCTFPSISTVHVAMLSTATPQSHQPSSDPSWKFCDQSRVPWHYQHRLGSPRTSLTFQAALPPNHCSPFTPRHLKLSPKRKKKWWFSRNSIFSKRYKR